MLGEAVSTLPRRRTGLTGRHSGNRMSRNVHQWSFSEVRKFRWVTERGFDIGFKWPTSLSVVWKVGKQVVSCVTSGGLLNHPEPQFPLFREKAEISKGVKMGKVTARSVPDGLISDHSDSVIVPSPRERT